MTEIGMELLERYLAGKATPEECRQIEGWLAEDPRRWAEVAALRESLEARDLSDRAVEEALAEVWERLAAEVEAGEGSAVRLAGLSGRGAREFSIPGRRMKPLVGVAAAIIVLTVGGGLAATLLLRRPPAPAEAALATTTAPGERATFRLPDGTRVMLGVASTLRYPKTFPEDGRQLALEGEAYFDVAHEEGRPFVVRAGGLVAKDLGTQFTVRAYPEDRGARVVVREGKVAIRALADGPERIVAPGQLGRLSAGGQPMVEPADTAVWFAWLHGRLVFANTPLREAVKQIERARDVEIRLSPSEVGDRVFTTSFGDEPTSDILQVIGTGLRLDVVQTGSRSYTLRAR